MAKDKKLSPKLPRFRKKELIIFGLVFAAIGGYFLWQAFALSGTKIWDTQAEFQAGTLSQLVANSNGTVTLAQQASQPAMAVNPPSTISLDFETGNFNQFEIGGTGTSPQNNWPYGEVFDATMFGAPGDKRVSLINASTDPAHVRLGQHAVKLLVRDGDTNYIHPGVAHDAVWVRNFQHESSTYGPSPGSSACGGAASVYKACQSRTNYLPQDNDIPGREVYWGMSIFNDPNLPANTTSFATGVDFHVGGACPNVSNNNLALESDKLVFYMRGSLNPDNCLKHYQTVVAFNDDGTFYKKAAGCDGGCSHNLHSETAWKPIQKGIWYDFVFKIKWNSSSSHGTLQIWIQKNKSGVYKEVLPPTQAPIGYTYTNASGQIVAGKINPYFGMYRNGSVTSDWTMWIDEIKRGKTFNEVAIPDSTISGNGGYVSSGSIILTHDAGKDTDWQSLTPVETKPTGTSITYETRSSNDNSTWSNWQSGITNTPNGRYLQARATLATTSSSQTPVLDKLTVGYDTIETIAPTVSLTANPTTISSGSSSTLSWSSTNASSCSASGAWSGGKATSGSMSVSPTTTSIYNLSCTGSGGSASASATVTVTTASPPPPPSAPTITSNINNGDSVPAGTTWSVSVSPTPSLVEFWSDGVKLADDTSAPFSTVLNLPAGSHRLGLCTTISGQRTCQNDVSTGVFAIITITDPSPPAHIAAGDLNNDGSVNILDLSILLKHYGTTAQEADINGDGVVNITDLSILLNKYE